VGFNVLIFPTFCVVFHGEHKAMHTGAALANLLDQPALAQTPQHRLDAAL
jgi:hypothetical protein